MTASREPEGRAKAPTREVAVRMSGALGLWSQRVVLVAMVVPTEFFRTSCGSARVPVTPKVARVAGGAQEDGFGAGAGDDETDDHRTGAGTADAAGGEVGELRLGREGRGRGGERDGRAGKRVVGRDGLEIVAAGVFELDGAEGERTGFDEREEGLERGRAGGFEIPVVAVKIVGDGRVLVINGDGQLRRAADGGGLGGGLSGEDRRDDGRCIKISDTRDVVGLERLDVGDETIESGGDVLAGRGEIGMGQSEDVAEFVEQDAAEIGGYGLGGWTPGGAAKGIPDDRFVDDDVGFTRTDGVAEAVGIVEEGGGEFEGAEGEAVGVGRKGDLIEPVELLSGGKGCGADGAGETAAAEVEIPVVEGGLSDDVP